MTADLQLEIEDRWLTTPRGEDEVPSTTKRVKSLTIDGDAAAPSSGPASAPPSDPAPPPRAAGSAFSEGPTLESLRAQLAAFARARDWDQFHTPRNVLLACLLYTSPSPRDGLLSRMPSSA